MRPLSRACGWIDAHLDAFSARGQGSQLLAELKAIGELAHAADFLLRAAAPEARETGRRWLDIGLAAIDGGEVVRMLIASDPQYVLAATTFVPFHLAGHSNPALRATLEAQLAIVAMPPFAWQMLVPTLLMLGIEPDPARREQAWRRGVLANRPADLPTMPADPVYLMAHECFYATHWGHIPAAYGHLIVQYVAEMLPQLIALYTEREHADLLAELLLATHTQRLPCAPRAAWDVLERAQSADGNIVPPERPGTDYPRLSHSILPRTYHTTLVAIMAWAACDAQMRLCRL